MKPKRLNQVLVLAGVCITVHLLLTQMSGQQQQPRTAEQAFKNIQVIKNMPASQLQSSMAFMAASLSVDCSHCHTRPAMENDDKPAKQIARRMLLMVNDINKNFGDKMVVNCATCHRGSTKPSFVPPAPSLTSPFAPAVSTSASQPLPTVDEILERYLQALGGAKALDKLKTRIRKGAVEVAGMRGTFELFETAPNKSLLIGSLPPPMGSVHQAFDGSVAWTKNQSGVFEMRGEGEAQARREADFFVDIKLKDQFKAMSVVGRERIDNRDFFIIEARRDVGPSERLFFDVQTGFLVRRYWTTPTYFGPLPNAVDFDNYKKVGNVKMPFIIRRLRGGQPFLQTITEIKLNVPIGESMFKKPQVQK